MAAILKTVDTKGRLLLGKEYAGRSVIVDDSNGTLTIEPAVAIPAREAWLYSNVEAIGAVRRGLAQARSREFVDSPADLCADAKLPWISDE